MEGWIKKWGERYIFAKPSSILESFALCRKYTFYNSVAKICWWMLAKFSRDLHRDPRLRSLIASKQPGLGWGGKRNLLWMLFVLQPNIIFIFLLYASRLSFWKECVGKLAFIIIFHFQKFSSFVSACDAGDAPFSACKILITIKTTFHSTLWLLRIWWSSW